MRLPSFFLAGLLSLLPSLAFAQTARLHVDAPRFTKVLGRPVGGGEWTQVCSVPCDAPVPLDWRYRMQSRGMKTSPAFQLAAGAGDAVVVHLHPACTAWFVGGVVATGAGATTAVVGIPFLLLRGIGCGWVVDDCTRQLDAQLGGVAAVSAALVALGVFAIATNDKTTVTQGTPAPAEAPREPMWHTTERRDVPPPSSALGAPLVTLRF